MNNSSFTDTHAGETGINLSRRPYRSQSALISKDADKINKLADHHPGDPEGFINSLDAFFRNMCREMVNNRKGGVL